MSEIYRPSESGNSGEVTPNTSKNKETKKDKEAKRKRATRGGAEASAEAAAAQEASKKEEVAQEAKTLWQKLVESDRDDNQAEEDSPEHKTAEQIDEDAETTGETIDEIAQLTPEEVAEARLAYIEPRLAELEAGRGMDADPADAAAREENIRQLQEEMAIAREALPAETNETDEAVALEATAEEPADGPEQAIEQPAEFDEDKPIPLSGSAGSGRAATPPPTPQQSAPPPRQPASPFAQPSPTGGGGWQPPSGPGGIPRPAAPNLAPAGSWAKLPEYKPDYHVNPNATYLLVGGLVGYFLGRRRGRIKTEKRMRAVQDKLEKQIESQQQQIVRQEVIVQRQAREEYRRKFIKESPENTSNPIPVNRENQALRQPERSDRPFARNERETSAASRPEQRVPASPERTTAASTRAEQIERQAAKIDLSDKQVIELSATISVGETSLKKIYEAKLVTESGLRRLVREHLEGRDIRRALAREFLAKELSYERDPQMRDTVSVGSDQTRASQPQNAVSFAAKSLVDDSVITAGQSSVQPSTQQPLTVSQKSKKDAHVSNAILAVMTCIAIGLALVAVVLTLRR